MAEEQPNSRLERVFGAVFILLLVYPAMMYKGFILSKLWAWFVVPLGVHPITLWHAYGLAMIVGLFQGVRIQTQPKERVEKVISKAITSAFVWPTLSWGIAYLVHYWMMQPS